MDDFIETADEWEDTGLDDAASSDEAEIEADQPESQEPPEEGQNGDKPTQRETDQFLLKHLGNERTVTREEIIPLAQKGLDYDRVRAKLTEQQKCIPGERLVSASQESRWLWAGRHMAGGQETETG